MQNHLPYWLATLFMPEVGPRTVFRWLLHFSTIETLFNASTEEWQAAGISQKHQQALRDPNWRAVEQELAWADNTQHHILCSNDSHYPPLLKEISDPPLVLYVRGDASLLSHIQLAIVGSRNATPFGITNAEQFARYLAEAGFVITSGLALGVDAASHRGALAAKGKTIGVLGTGLKHMYPASHRMLAEEMINQGGALVSEFPLETLAKAQHFPRRNRIIGGLSQGVLVVEAALKSGSLITARHALEQGREVFAIPGSIHHPLARGCHHLIKQGAKLVEKAADVLEELQVSLPNLNKNKRVQAEATPAVLHPLLEQIDYAVTSLDRIILQSGLTAGEVSSILLRLELLGHIHTVSGGYVRAVPN